MKFFTLFFCTLFVSSACWANISISPFYLSFDADSNKRSEQVRLTNTGNTTQTYRVKLIQYKQQKDGSYQPITNQDNSFSAEPYLEFSPREITLEPYQTQTIRVQRKPMSTTPSGEYVSHLMIQELAPSLQPTISVSSGLSVDLKALYGITIPVMIEKGELTDSASIAKATLKTEQKKSIAHVTVSHTGTRSFYGKIVILDGKTEIGRMDNFRIFVGTPERLLSIPLTQKPTGKLSIQLLDARSDALLSTHSL